LAGHETDQREVRVAGGEQRTIEIELRALTPGSAKLQIDCALPDVRIEVDDKLSATTPTKQPLRLQAGARRVVFRRDGYTNDVHRLTLAAGAAARIACRLSPLVPVPPGSRATLAVRVSERGASVHVDGRALPQGGAVPAGRHLVLVTRAGFEPWSRELKLETGEHRVLDVELRPNARYRAEQHSRASSQRFWALATAGTGAALGLTAIGIYIWNDGRHDDWRQERDALDAEANLGSPDPQDFAKRQRDNDALLESVQRWDGINLGVGIAGGALITTGAVLFLLGDDPGKYAEAATLVPAPGGGVLSWSTPW
jgi:hypothetical protein